jgi:hypothetical protein
VYCVFVDIGFYRCFNGDDRRGNALVCILLEFRGDPAA